MLNTSRTIAPVATPCGLEEVSGRWKSEAVVQWAGAGCGRARQCGSGWRQTVTEQGSSAVGGRGLWQSKATLQWVKANCGRARQFCSGWRPTVAKRVSTAVGRGGQCQSEVALQWTEADCV